MKPRECLCLFVFLAIALTSSRAQVEMEQPALDEIAQNETKVATPPSDGEPQSASSDNTGPPSSNVSPDANFGFSIAQPPPGTPGFFLLGLFLSESFQTETATQGDSSQNFFSTRVSGNLDLLKFWHRSVTALDYVGGGIFYSLHDTEQLQTLNVSHSFLGQKRELTFADSLSNLPGGSFGAAPFGGAGLYSLVFAGTGAGIQPGSGLANLFGSTTLAGIAEGQQITNIAMAEFTQALTPRSVISVAGGYGITDYYGQSKNLINNSQLSTLARYSYLLSPRSQIGVIYGYRSFQFPEVTEGQVTTDLVQLVYQRQFSHRMTFSFGAGPEFTALRRQYRLTIPPEGPLCPSVNPCVISFTATTHQINASAFALLAYRLRTTSFTISYDRLVTSGSGLVAGANSDIVVFSVGGPISAVWQANVNAGYVRNSSIAETSPGIPAESYQNGYAGIAVRRGLGQHFSFLASYQFNALGYTSSCAQLNICGGITRQNTGLIGLYWNFRPVRLD